MLNQYPRKIPGGYLLEGFFTTIPKAAKTIKGPTIVRHTGSQFT